MGDKRDTPRPLLVFFKELARSAPPVDRGIIEITIQYSEFSSFGNSPLERGASSTSFKKIGGGGVCLPETCIGTG
jgi:hypothetical protein